MESNPATIIKNAVEDLSKKIEFTAGEIATFKEALCGIGEKMNDSSNKLLRASKFYFWGSLILTTVIAFAILVQAKIINLEKTIKNKNLTKRFRFSNALFASSS
ncbi:MAG: hypothetical protein ABH865_07460 [Candidatus Omnitrophota bacterium]